MVRAVLFLLAFISRGAFAGYAQLSPPPSFQSVGGVSTIAVNAASNSARYAGGYVMAESTLSLGARSVVVPVAFRVAANASIFAVTKMNPWFAGLQLAASAIPYVLDWLSTPDADGNVSGLTVDQSTGVIVRSGRWKFGDQFGDVQNPDGVDLDASLARSSDYGNVSLRVALDWWIAHTTGLCGRGPYTIVKMYPAPNDCGPGIDAVIVNTCISGGPSLSAQICSGGPVVTGVGPGSGPVTASDVEFMRGVPVKPSLLPEIGLPIPVDPVPVINPLTQPVGDPLVGPAVNPAPELAPDPNPLRFPDGDPVPIPNTDPQTYSQPWYEVKPSPTQGDPWRVDVTQGQSIVNSPDPMPDPTPSPSDDPRPVPDFYTDCDKYPGSLGCMPVGSLPDSESIPSVEKQITLQQGPSFGGGSCPANLVVSLMGHQFTVVDMVQPCNWISNLVKPIILLLAAISAVFIVVPKSEG